MGSVFIRSDGSVLTAHVGPHFGFDSEGSDHTADVRSFAAVAQTSAVFDVAGAGVAQSLLDELAVVHDEGPVVCPDFPLVRAVVGDAQAPLLEVVHGLLEVGFLVHKRI